MQMSPIMQEQNEESKASMTRKFLCEEYMTYSAQVALAGLKSKPELNGRIGMVAGELTAEGRLPVQLWDDGSAADVSVRIKLENLRPLPDDYLDPHEKEMKLRGGPLDEAARRRARVQRACVPELIGGARTVA